MANEFWLSDVQWAAIEPLLPRNQPGARRVDDRRVISGIIHVLKVGCPWQDCPAVHGPATTVYNRFHRWAMRRLWRRLFEALVRADPGDVHAIDSTTAKAHRSAAGGSVWPAPPASDLFHMVRTICENVSSLSAVPLAKMEIRAF